LQAEEKGGRWEKREQAVVLLYFQFVFWRRFLMGHILPVRWIREPDRSLRPSETPSVPASIPLPAKKPSESWRGRIHPSI
jgi:hypothetical protein